MVLIDDIDFQKWSTKMGENDKSFCRLKYASYDWLRYLSENDIRNQYSHDHLNLHHIIFLSQMDFEFQ